MKSTDLRKIIQTAVNEAAPLLPPKKVVKVSLSKDTLNMLEKGEAATISIQSNIKTHIYLLPNVIEKFKDVTHVISPNLKGTETEYRVIERKVNRIEIQLTLRKPFGK